MAQASVFFSQRGETASLSRSCLSALPVDGQLPRASRADHAKRPLEKRRCMREMAAATCGICLEAVGDRGVLLHRLASGMLVQSCTHAFCFICVVTWAERTNTCPMCKTRFNAVRRAHAQRARGVGETIEPGSRKVALGRKKRTSRVDSLCTGCPPQERTSIWRTSSKSPVVENKDPDAEGLSEDEDLAAALAMEEESDHSGEDEQSDQGGEGEDEKDEPDVELSGEHAQRRRYGYVMDDFVVSDGTASVEEDSDDDYVDGDGDGTSMGQSRRGCPAGWGDPGPKEAKEESDSSAGSARWRRGHGRPRGAGSARVGAGEGRARAGSTGGGGDRQAAEVGETRVLPRELRHLQQEAARLVGSSPLRPRRRPPPRSRLRRGPLSSLRREARSNSPCADGSSPHRGESPVSSENYNTPRPQRRPTTRGSRGTSARLPLTPVLNSRESARGVCSANSDPEDLEDVPCAGRYREGQSSGKSGNDGGISADVRDRSSAAASGTLRRGFPRTMTQQSSGGNAGSARSSGHRAGNRPGAMVRRPNQGGEGWGPWISRGREVTGCPPRLARIRDRQDARSDPPAGGGSRSRGGTTVRTLSEWCQQSAASRSAGRGTVTQSGRSTTGTRGSRDSGGARERRRSPTRGLQDNAAICVSDEEKEVEWTETSSSARNELDTNGCAVRVASGQEDHMGEGRRKRLWKESCSGGSGDADGEEEEEEDEEIEFAWSVEKAPRPRREDDREVARHQDAGRRDGIRNELFVESSSPAGRNFSRVRRRRLRADEEREAADRRCTGSVRHFSAVFGSGGGRGHGPRIGERWSRVRVPETSRTSGVTSGRREVVDRCADFLTTSTTSPGIGDEKDVERQRSTSRDLSHGKGASGGQSEEELEDSDFAPSPATASFLDRFRFTAQINPGTFLT